MAVDDSIAKANMEKISSVIIVDSSINIQALDNLSGCYLGISNLYKVGLLPVY